MYLPESTYCKYLHEVLIDQKVLDQESVGNFYDRYLLVCLNDKYAVIYSLFLRKIVKLLDNNYNVGVLLNKYVYTRNYLDKYMMCIIYSDFKNNKKNESTYKHKPFYVNEFINNYQTLHSNTAELKEGTIPYDFDGDRFLYGIYDEFENYNLYIQYVDDQNDLENIYKYVILEGSENYFYKWFQQTFHPMPVVNFASLVKGKNEIYMLRQENYIEKWVFQRGSYATIVQVGSTVKDVIAMKLLQPADFYEHEFYYVPQPLHRGGGSNHSNEYGVGGKDLYSVNEVSSMNNGFNNDNSHTLNLTVQPHNETQIQSKDVFTKVTNAKFNCEDVGPGGKSRSMEYSETIWTVETDFHVRCYNAENMALLNDINLHELSNLDHRISVID